MALVQIQWVTETRTIPQTTPPLDSFRVAVGIPGSSSNVASVILPGLDTRSANLDVPEGVGYVALVTLVSADGSSTGPSATSALFTVPSSLPAPVSVTVSL